MKKTKRIKMTKPECSKAESSSEEELVLEIKNDSSDDKKKSTNPKTVKDLFAVFAPESDSAEDENHNEDEPSAKKSKDSSPKKRVPVYRKEWESKPDLKPWLSESIHGNMYFYCKFCKKDYRSGISDIYKHMAAKKHVLSAALPAFTAQKFKFRGLLCPVFTPFTTSRRAIPEINTKAIKKYAGFLKACKINGILINDIMGEGMSLTTRERIEVTDIWADACEKHNQFLMVQIGGAPVKDVIEMAKHANKKTVGAVVILPDLYNKPKDHLDLIRYIKLLSEYSKNTPILYHHNPKFTKVEIDVNALLLDIVDEVETFVGLIYSSNDIQLTTAAMTLNKEKFTVFMGTDECILGAVASGFSCIMGVSLNFLPKLAESICEAVKSGNLKGAQVSQSLLNRTIDVIAKEGDTIAAFKAATDIITNTCGTTTREPIQTLWEGTTKKLHDKLKHLGVV